MPLLGDRNFASPAPLNEQAATGADPLTRRNTNPNPLPAARRRDGPTPARTRTPTGRDIDRTTCQATITMITSSP